MSDLQQIKLDLLLEQLSSHGRAEVKANGSSMNPFIKMGDLLYLETHPDGQYQEGEIVAFTRDSLVYIHRLISLDKSSGIAVTKGDNLENTDEWLKKEEIVARVVQINQSKIRSRLCRRRMVLSIYRCSMFLFNPHIIKSSKKTYKIHLEPGRFKLTKFILRFY